MGFLLEPLDSNQQLSVLNPRFKLRPLSKLLLQSVKPLLFPLLNPSTTTMLMNPSIPTSTHSSTHTTQPTVTFSLTGTEPTLLPRATQPMLTTLSTAFQLVPTVPELTHSSTHLMLLTNKPGFLQVTKPEFSSEPLSNSSSSSLDFNQLNLSNRHFLSRPLLQLPETFFHQVSSA